MKEALHIIYFGTPEFAVDPLDILVRNGFTIAAVVTAPDQPAGRGRQIQASPVKLYALEHNIKVLQPEKLKNPEFIAELSALNADLFIVVAFRMLPEIVWQMPRLGTFNLHASLLPQYRGAAPINHAIINGETETGLTTFFLKQEIDTGDILLRDKIAIGPEETAGELHDRMKEAGAGLVIKTVRAILAGNTTGTGQHLLSDPSVPLKPAPKIFRDDCRIDWGKSTLTIFNLIRGLSPYPAAFTTFTDPAGAEHIIKIYRSRPVTEPSLLPPSSLITDEKTKILVATSDGMIDILELQQAGKRKMLTEEFLRGFRINSDWKVG